MRLALAFALFASLPALAEPGEGRFSKLDVWTTHEWGKGVRTERIRLESGKRGLELTVEVTVDGKVQKSPAVLLADAVWKEMDSFLAWRGLLDWKEKPGVAPDWGQQGFEIQGPRPNKQDWTGPFKGWAPPLSLQRRMAELAHAHAPKTALEFFKSDRGPAKRRIRTWTNAGGLVLPPKHGGPVHEIEAEEWDGVRTVTVRQLDHPGMVETTTEITAGAWDKLWTMATAKPLKEWDGKAGLMQTVDHGGGGLDVLGPDTVLQLRWEAPDLPCDDGAIGELTRALLDAAKTK